MLKGGAAGVLCCGILCIGEVSSVNTILRLTGVLGGDIIMVGLVGSIGEIGTDAAVVGKNTLVSVAGGMMGEHANRRDVEGPIGECVGIWIGAGVAGGGGRVTGD